MSEKSRYINPYTDFGFKKLFGEEANKDLLKDFLNQLLPTNHLIAELNLKNVENSSSLSVERKAIFDIHCMSKTGKRFIVEMQKAKIKYFKDRSLFYTTFPIREQAEKGDWDFELDPIYYIAILDFFYDVEKEKAKVRRSIQLRDQDCEVFYDKLHYIFLQMPAFKKEEHELKTHYDKWLFFLKNLADFEDIPDILNEPVFTKAFHIAEISNLTKGDYQAYQESLLSYRDMLNVMRTKYEEGLEKGIDQGMERIISMCFEQGKSVSDIAAFTGLSKEVIERYKKL